LPSRVFRAYYLAEFPEEEGVVFGNISNCFKKDHLFEPAPLNLSETFVLAADLAKHEDYTWISVWSVQRRKVVWMDEWKDLSWELTLKKIAAVAAHYNNAEIIMDQTGLGDPLVEQIRGMDIQSKVEGYVFGNQSKRAVIDGLILGFEKQDFVIPYHSEDNHFRIMERAKEELESYEYEISDAGNIKYDAAEGFDCDAVISLALGYWKISNFLTPGFRSLDITGAESKQEKSLLTEEQILAKKKLQEEKNKNVLLDHYRNKLINLFNRGDDDNDDSD
jgi:hypothetical protein